MGSVGVRSLTLAARSKSLAIEVGQVFDLTAMSAEKFRLLLRQAFPKSGRRPDLPRTFLKAI